MAVVDIKGFKVLIDDEDVERVMKIVWHLNSRRFKRDGRTYFSHTISKGPEKHKELQLHHFIIDCPKGFVVDHANNDPLDNRKCNLRICTPSQNQMNRGKEKTNKSGYKGVHYFKWGHRIKRWKAEIGYDGKTHFIGYFATKEEAYAAYCEAAKKYHGEFARVA
jgi:hypothetical protein